MTRELQRAIQAMAVECDDTYAMANSIEDMLEEIFDDHEAQLKLASDVYSTDKMHMYQELKAKDKITQDIKEAYELKSIAYDLLLEAIQLKDEEIERLKVQLINAFNDTGIPRHRVEKQQ